jgi:hypothetical protein
MELVRGWVDPNIELHAQIHSSRLFTQEGFGGY